MVVFYTCVPVLGSPQKNRVVKGIKVEVKEEVHIKNGAHVEEYLKVFCLLLTWALCRIHTCIQRLISKPLRGEYNLKPDLTRVTFLRLPQVFCFKTLLSTVDAFLAVLTLFNRG